MTLLRLIQSTVPEHLLDPREKHLKDESTLHSSTDFVCFQVYCFKHQCHYLNRMILFILFTNHAIAARLPTRYADNCLLKCSSFLKGKDERRSGGYIKFIIAS